MSYISQNPLDFNLRRDYVAPLGDALAFNLGVELSDSQAIGVIDFTLDDCVGVFAGFIPQKSIGTFTATLDDCVGAMSAAWLFQPQSISVGLLCPSNTAKVQSVSLQSPLESAQLSTRQTYAPQQQASVLERQTVSALEQCEVLRKNTRHHATDLHTHTHKFNSNLFKEPPEQYRYTPTAVFDFGITLNERSFSVTTDEYVAANPVYFNLLETISTELNFDLGLTQTQPVTRTRQIFDNVSTYQPETLFFAPWVNDHLIFNHSYERAGLRLATHNQIERADVIAQNYKANIQAAIKAVFRFKQSQNNALKISLKYNQALNIAQKIANNVHFKTQKAVNITRRYRELVQLAQIIWGSNQTLIIADPPRPDVIPPPINHVTITIPQKQVYTMQHSISVTLENLTPISVDAVKLAIDSDSFAWSFSANLLDLSQLDLVKQTGETPVTLIITIDGTVFKMLVEKITRNRSFAKNSISLSGRSLSALLSQPYELPRSATQSSLMTVQQLAELELPNGWTINWTTTSWNVDSGAWSYTAKTPIQVITEIAANIGAMVVPSRNAKVLNIMPRYTVLPWLFDATTPDLIIPDSAIVSLSYRNVIPTQANGVYIHGSEIGGVLSRCRLSGTAGDRLAATVTNPLMTNVIGTRALGEKILADNYEQPAIQSVSLKLGGDYPLVNVGDFVRINIDGGQVRGVVNSVSIDASLDSVNQTIQIGAESANVWTSFKQLTPSNPLLVGTIALTTETQSLVTLIDGGVVGVRGVGAVNEKWYIRNGALESIAPSLTLSEIVI
jgi:hypothetical protein